MIIKVISKIDYCFPLLLTLRLKKCKSQKNNNERDMTDVSPPSDTDG